MESSTTVTRQLLLRSGVERNPGPEFTCTLCFKYRTTVKQNMTRHVIHTCPSRPAAQRDGERSSKRRKVQQEDKEVILCSPVTSLSGCVHRWLALYPVVLFRVCPFLPPLYLFRSDQQGEERWQLGGQFQLLLCLNQPLLLHHLTLPSMLPVQKTR